MSIQKLLECFERSFEHPAEGDRCVMLAALYNRLLDKSLVQDRGKRPERTRVIHKILEKNYDIAGLPKWGATAVRGDLMDNKEHIRSFIDNINDLDSMEIDRAWDECCLLYKKRMETKRKEVRLNSEESIFNTLISLAHIKSGGLVQQHACYASIKYYYESLQKSYEVQTKSVFAGDQQSSLLGDIQVSLNDKLVIAYEVKAHIVDNQKINEVLSDHGDHPYPLVVLGGGFKTDVIRRKNLSLVKIQDFIETICTLSSAMTLKPLEEVSREMITIYNHSMMANEDRPNLTIDLLL